MPMRPGRTSPRLILALVIAGLVAGVVTACASGAVPRTGDAPPTAVLAGAAQETMVPAQAGAAPVPATVVPARATAAPPGVTPASAPIPDAPPSSAATAAAAQGTPKPDSGGAGPGAGLAVPWPSPIADVEPSPLFSLQVPILMYHRIVPAGLAGDSLPGLVVSPELFDAQLAALHAAGWHTVTVAQISQALQLHRTLPPRTFAISIDDGWDDGYTYALPVLQRYGFHATYYVIAGRVGTWKNVLTPAELRALAAAGMEIGDHTLDHRALPYLSQAQMHVQVVAAADLLATFVGERPATFAYPSGRYDLAAEEEVQADGFGMAVIEGSGAWEGAANQFAVPRVRVSPTTTPAWLLAQLRALEPGA
jgi:peptidoglycan/xylan/chitin deacetylase (PgdA/CDA1 family)